MAFLGTETEKNTVFSSLETLADIPLTDYAAWEMYPKYRWVYSTSRLLDLQNIKWSPFYNNELCASLEEFAIDSKIGNVQEVWQQSTIQEGKSVIGAIFVKPTVGEYLTTDAVILKGELKWLAHHTRKAELDKNQMHVGKKVLNEVRGDIELRISALSKMALPKYTGVISVDTIGTTIVSTRLRMTPDVIEQYPDGWMKSIIKLYNRKQWNL